MKPGRRALAPAVVLALACASSCGRAAHPAGAPVVSDALRSVVWDDGRAEVSLYSGVTPESGEERRTTARWIVVKEDLLRATLVKSDSGPIAGKTVAAIKCNFISDWSAGTYDEHEMAVVMLERSSGQALKETASHTDGCGITFVRVGPVKGTMTHEAHSYWEGEADRVTKIEMPSGGLVFEDALPVWLRLWAGQTPFPADLAVWMLPGQLGARAPLASASAVRAVIRRTAGGSLETPAGHFECVAFSVETPSGLGRYWLDKRPPHVLVRVERAGGAWLELRRTMRIDYWNHTRNGDERLLGEVSPGP
jgi:hypothetical protein